MRDLEGLLSVIASFALGLITNWLSDRRSTKKDERDYIREENDMLSRENDKLRRENDKLRRELDERHETDNKGR